jgi:hypothetical protein
MNVIISFLMAMKSYAYSLDCFKCTLYVARGITSVQCSIFNVGFEVFTAMSMKKVVFWDLAPYSCGWNPRFGGTYRLHLQGR